MKVKLPDFDSLVKEVMSGDVSFERLKELSQKNLDLARALAENPASPPELLEIMARRRDSIILANVTANPNTPTQVLCNLGKRFPHQFLKNPILSLLLLENPNFFQQMPLNTIVSLRDYILEHCYSDKGIPKLETYDGLAPDLILQQFIKYYDSSVRFYIAKHQNTPLNILEQLATDNYEHARYGIAFNRNAPVHILEKLVVDKSSYVRSGVAQNPNISIKSILNLANDRSLDVNLGVISNQKAPAQIIDALLNKFKQHKNAESFLAWIASSYQVNPYALESLSTSDIRKIRIYVAGNRKTPQKTLKQMALVENEHRLVLREIARNIATPNETLKLLAQERRITISEAALDNLRIPEVVRASWLA